MVGGPIAGRKNSWLAVQAIHLQARVIGEGPLPGEGGYGFCLEPGIGPIGGACLFYLKPLGLGVHV